MVLSPSNVKCMENLDLTPSYICVMVEVGIPFCLTLSICYNDLHVANIATSGPAQSTVIFAMMARP